MDWSKRRVETDKNEIAGGAWPYGVDVSQYGRGNVAPQWKLL